MAASWGGKNSWGCLRRSRREVSAVRTMEIRHCPYCAGDRARAKREDRRQAREDREDREKMEGLERRLAGSLESFDRQSKALDKAYRYIAALENELKRERKRRRWTRRK
jgi:hypothetical protein